MQQNEPIDVDALANKDRKNASKPVDPADIIKLTNKLQAGKFHVYKYYPFLGHILQRLGVVITNDIPTMAVDNIGNIYLNPDFSLNKLTFQEFVGVLVHETMHISTLTLERERGRNHQLWNVATDYIMNRDIIKAGITLPAQGCIPTKQGDKDYIVELTGKHGPFTVNITDATAEYLFTQLAKNATIINVYPLDQVLKGQGLPQPVEGTAPGVNKTPQQIANDVISANEAAKADQAEKEKERGVGSGGLREHIMSHHRPKVNWRQLLKSIVAKTITEYNYKRPHKRALAAGYFAPRAQTYDTLAPICVAIDTSGSITDKELTVFVSELQAIFRVYRRAQLTVVLWHSESYFHVEINQINNPLLLTIVKQHLQSGGTTMSSVANYLTKRDLQRKVAAVVYLTDGHVEGNPTLLERPIKNYALVTDNYGLDTLKKNSKHIDCFKINID